MSEQSADLVWQGNPRGLREALLDAQKKEVSGDELGAEVMRASAYYSYVKRRRNPLRMVWDFSQAKRHAREAMRLARFDERELSHGAYDVIGTILLRSGFGWKALPEEASWFFQKGLSIPHAPPHSRALLFMGEAEANYLLWVANAPSPSPLRSYHQKSEDALKHALALERSVAAEENTVFARRQFTRVLRRAMVLAAGLNPLDLTGDAHLHYERAKAYAHVDPDPRVCEDMRCSIEREWNRLLFPRFWHRFLPQ